MALPDVPMPTEKVDTPGGPILVRGLSAGEAAKIGKIVDAKDLYTAEVTIIALATDTTKAEAKKWYDAVPAGTAKAVIDTAHRLSGLDGEASKSVEAGTPEG